MGRLQNVWVVATNMDLCEELCSGASKLGEHIGVLYAGERDVPIYADTAYYLGKITNDKRWPAYINTVLGLVREKEPELLLLDTGKNGRLMAGYLAAACGTSVITDISELDTGDGVIGKRMIYGGTAYRTEQSRCRTTVICVGAGKLEGEQPGKGARMAEIVDVDMVKPDSRVRCRAIKQKEAVSVNIGAAKKVVSAGRGIGSLEELAMVEALAVKMDAAVGCSRPIAEEMKWLPREVYVGVSGVMIKPDVYIAIGISGQIQHLVGCNQAGIMIGINKDKNAPIFRHVDYGIVGDFRKVIPKLLEIMG